MTDERRRGYGAMITGRKAEVLGDSTANLI
jgi:hypothetical protein